MGAACAPPKRRGVPGARPLVAAALLVALLVFCSSTLTNVPPHLARGRPPRRMAAEVQAGSAHQQGGLGAGQLGPADRQFECKRVLWFAGLQAKTEDGSETHYITSSSSYLRYYAAALRSARERAPSLLPVLVVLNAMPQGFVDWVELQGAIVVRHQVSFASRMEAHASSDAWLKENLTKQLMASYARLDIPAIMDRVTAQLPAYLQSHERQGAAASAAGVPTQVDLEAVLWTDPDILFRHDISSCTLPKPRLLSIGPELAKQSVVNCGVMHFNVAAYTSTLPAMLDYADSRHWTLLHDQDLVEQFFKSPAAAKFRQPWHVLTGLPDAYNYKAYWGEPEAGWLGLFQHQVGDVAIVHTHGPKPEMSLCVIEYLQKNIKKKAGWEPKHVVHRKSEIVSACGIQVALYLDELLQIMAGAFKADGGEMYRWVMREQERLCPGACWVSASVRDSA